MTHIDVLKQCREALNCSVVWMAHNGLGDLTLGSRSAITAIDSLPTEIGQTSDGYHTLDELYEHRFELWIALCQSLRKDIAVYKSRVHSDGSSFPGWFLLGMGIKPGQQISYHLPYSLWDRCDFVEMAPPPFDGHTSADVLDRLRNL